MHPALFHRFLMKKTDSFAGCVTQGRAVPPPGLPRGEDGFRNPAPLLLQPGGTFGHNLTDDRGGAAARAKGDANR
jgi:hypothetical protein